MTNAQIERNELNNVSGEAIDVEALAQFFKTEVEGSEKYEDDTFWIEFKGERFYVERCETHYYVETLHGQDLELPR